MTNNKYTTIHIRRDLFDRLVMYANPVDTWDAVLRRLIDEYNNTTTTDPAEAKP